MSTLNPLVALITCSTIATRHLDGIMDINAYVFNQVESRHSDPDLWSQTVVYLIIVPLAQLLLKVFTLVLESFCTTCERAFMK